MEIPKAKEENNPLNTLMLMANLQNVDQVENEPIFEGRGTVSCHLCSKSFILKTLLKRHYIAAHSYQSKNELISNLNCQECSKEFKNNDEAIKHHLDFHAQISGQICPYCDCKYGAKKFDNLDAHVSKHHVLEMQSPIQTCSTCKTNFNNYEALKVHRQIHEGKKTIAAIHKLIHIAQFIFQLFFFPVYFFHSN